MGTDAGLNAEIDTPWMNVVLTARGVRNDTLRQLAEAMAEDSERVIFELRALAAALDRPAAGWDEAVTDLEANLQLDEAALELREDEALRLADELTAAAALTYTARRRAAAPVAVVIPLQKRRVS
jgi:hypothetical protein